MKTRMIATLCCSAFSCALYAQNGWLPPVSIPANTNMCDPTPWKLVLYDDFNGSNIDITKWKTYVTWDGMYVVRNNDTISKPDHADWGGARLVNGDPNTTTAIFKDENVVVSGGTCKLLLKNEPNTTWTTHDSTHLGNPLRSVTEHLTAGMIATPFLKSNGSPNYFNSGKFEARIKFPIFNNAWCAFWTWHGATVNEIDIAEAWGGGLPIMGPRRHNTSNLHAWGPGANDPNPYSLPYDANGPGIDFPGQTWWITFITPSKRHKQEDWHTYTSVWDTASIKTYLDGSLVNTVWKYYTTRGYLSSFGFRSYLFFVGSGCNSANGNWNITYGYPYNSTNSESQLRLSTGYSEGFVGDPNGGTYTKGEMEIDYVKIWQRHPEQDGHTDICADNTYPAVTLTGPSELCAQGTYTVSPSVTGGIWSWGNYLTPVSTSASSMTVVHDMVNGPSTSYVRYSFPNGVEGCPLKTIGQQITCPLAPWSPAFNVFSTNDNNTGHFQLGIDLYLRRDVIHNTTPIVQWNVSLTKGSYTHDTHTAENYVMYGQYVTTPSFNVTSDQEYNLQWTMTAYLNGDTIKHSGERSSRSHLFQQSNDTNVYYFNAYISDQNLFDEKVDYAIARQMISEEEANDDLFMDEMIERERFIALEPYLLMEPKRMAQGANNSQEQTKSITKIYPNPTKGNVAIIPGVSFASDDHIQLRVYNLLGKLVKVETTKYAPGNIIYLSLNNLPNDNYVIELKQGILTEHHKVTKLTD